MWTRFRFWCRGLQIKASRRIHEFLRRRRIFNQIARDYFEGKHNTAFRSSEDFNTALEIVKDLGIWESWRHDGVFYVIKFSRD